MTIITEIEIVPVKPVNGLVAFAGFLMDEKLYLGSVAIYKRRDGNGYRMTYPGKKIGNKNINTFHPINRETGQAIERAILKQAEEVLEK